MLSKVSAKFSLVKFLNQVIELLLSRFHLYQCLQPPVRKSHAEPMPKPWGFWHRFSNKITGQFWTVPRMPQTQLLRATCAIFLLNVAQGRRKSRKKKFLHLSHALHTRFMNHTICTYISPNHMRVGSSPIICSWHSQWPWKSSICALKSI